MDDSGVGEYRKIFLESSFDIINQIKSNCQSAIDVVLLHRLFHNLKGQILFMNLTDTGGICLKGEKFLEEIIKKKLTVDEKTKNTLIFLLDKIELDLKTYENTNR